MRIVILGVAAVSALVALVVVPVVIAPPPARPPGPFPINTTVRALSTIPERFDRQIVRIHGLVNLEFEDFSVHDPAWSDEPLGNPGHWVPRISVCYAELGRFDAGPLLRDDMFLAFDARMRERSDRRLMTGATMVGRFESEFVPLPVRAQPSRIRRRRLCGDAQLSLLLAIPVCAQELPFDGRGVPPSGNRSDTVLAAGSECRKRRVEIGRSTRRRRLRARAEVSSVRNRCQCRSRRRATRPRCHRGTTRLAAGERPR